MKDNERQRLRLDGKDGANIETPELGGAISCPSPTCVSMGSTDTTYKSKNITVVTIAVVYRNFDAC